MPLSGHPGGPAARPRLTSRGLRCRTATAMAAAGHPHDRLRVPTTPRSLLGTAGFGILLVDLGDVTGARTHQERALEIGQATLPPTTPRWPHFRDNLDHALQQLGDAERDMPRVLSQGPQVSSGDVEEGGLRPCRPGRKPLGFLRSSWMVAWASADSCGGGHCAGGCRAGCAAAGPRAKLPWCDLALNRGPVGRQVDSAPLAAVGANQPSAGGGGRLEGLDRRLRAGVVADVRGLGTSGRVWIVEHQGDLDRPGRHPRPGQRRRDIITVTGEPQRHTSWSRPRSARPPRSPRTSSRSRACSRPRTSPGPTT
jgi:hypothetical protein